MLKYIGCKLKGILDSIVRWYKSLKEWGYLLWLIIIVVSFIIVSNIPFFEIKQNMYYYESSKVYNIETKVTYNTSWYKVYRIYEHVVNLSEKDSDKIFSTYKSEYLKAEEFKKNYKKYIKNER